VLGIEGLIAKLKYMVQELQIVIRRKRNAKWQVTRECKLVVDKPSDSLAQRLKTWLSRLV
jgi:hypothetical protein